MNSLIVAWLTFVELIVIFYLLNKFLIRDERSNAVHYIFNTLFILLISGTVFLFNQTGLISIVFIALGFFVFLVALVKTSGEYCQYIEHTETSKNKLYLNRFSAGFAWFFAASYIIYQMVALFYMGDSEGSYWIFNIDNAYRLTHVWQLLEVSEYPPLSKSNYGISFHYHYGSAAIASLLVSLFSLSPDTALFHIIMPILMLAGISLLYFATKAYSGSKQIALMSVLISYLFTIDFSLLLPRLYNLFNEFIYFAYGVVRFLANLSDFPHAGFTHFDAGRFGNGVLDISYLSLYIMLVLAVYVFLLVSKKQSLVIYIFLAFISPFIKSEGFILFSICAFVVFFVQFFGCKRHAYKKLVTFLIAWMTLLVYFSVSNFGLSFGGVSFSVGFATNIENIFIFQLLFLLVIFYLFCIKGGQDKIYDELVVLFVLLLVWFVVSSVLNFSYSDGNGKAAIELSQSFDRLDNILLLFFAIVCLCKSTRANGHCYSTANNVTQNTAFKASKRSIFALILSLSSVKTYHLLFSFILLVFFTKHAHEASNLKDFHLCIEKVPESFQISSNSLSYPAENYKRGNIALHLTSLSSHQGFALNQVYENYQLVRDRVIEQNKLISNASTTFQEICNFFTKDTAIIVDKKFSFPASIQKKSLYSNQACIVVLVNENQCQSG